jgi:hypothetical protein
VETKSESMWSGWYSNEVYESYGVRVWKNIKRGWGFSLDS